MSDTDTDDTDLLLLIPPNYYSKTAERLFVEAKMSAAAAADALAMPPPSSQTAPTTAAYQFLPQSKKTELHQINARIQNLEVGEDYHFEAPSDISTISTNTVRTAMCSKRLRDAHGLVHSTPKSGSVKNDHFGRHSLGNKRLPRDDNILLEIDNYLDDRNSYSTHAWQKHHSDDYVRERECSMAFSGLPTQETQASSLPSSLNTQSRSAPVEAARHAADDKLISLSELWGTSNLAATVLYNNEASPLRNTTQLKEEQLRRQHLEKTVHALQSQLLECQQRISVAVEVDRTKDAALVTAEQASKALNYEVQHLRDAVNRLETERTDYNAKLDALQHELAQAVGLATKFQERNEKLEAELEKHRQHVSETSQQLEQLELQLQGSKRAEELAHAELNKLRDRFAKVDYQQEKLKKHIEEMNKEKTTLQHQKEMLQEYHQKQKSRADDLESQKKSMQESLANLTDIETNLKKKLEVQQKSLKMHYQQQLETVVSQKLQEFQNLLDKNEEQFKSEARERERLIAERAVKQLEMINEKNNLELNLIQEKHFEEVELYRLQLASAAKKIDELEFKLSSYKNKRADIAEKLHGVMEAQWQQALKILTSPNQNTHQQNSDTDCESLSLDQNNARNYSETPKTSKSNRSNNTEKNNLDVVGKKDPPSPMDKLQAYIELLLSKSPTDFDKLDEILTLSSKKDSKEERAGKRSVAGGHGKPPWKS